MSSGLLVQIIRANRRPSLKVQNSEVYWQTDWREEAGNVCGSESEDFESNKRAVGRV